MRANGHAPIRTLTRNERDDRHERQRRVEAAPIERKPRHEAGTRDVGPETERPPPSAPLGYSQRESEQRGELEQPQRSGWIEEREDPHPQRIVGDRQHQEK